MTSRNKTLAVFYGIAIIVSVLAVYYINATYNQPQPKVVVYYNYTVQAATGYILNTLGYGINVSQIFCTMPGGKRLEFKDAYNNSIAAGTNVSLTLGTSGKLSIPSNCTDWSVTYTKAGYIPPNNNPFVITGRSPTSGASAQPNQTSSNGPAS